MDKNILNAKIRRLKKLLSEGDVKKDCIRIICNMLYGKMKKEDITTIVYEDDRELDKKEIDEKEWGLSMDQVVLRYMEKNYKKSVNGKNIVPHYISRKNEKRKKISKQREERKKRQEQQEQQEQQEKSDIAKEYEFCFTRLDEIEEEYIQWIEKEETQESTGKILKLKEVSIEESEVRKQEQKRTCEKYYSAINNDFRSYYKSIQQTIMSSSAFVKHDLRYLLLQTLWLDISGNRVIDSEILSIWEQKYEFLDFPNLASRDAEKSNRKYFNYMKKKSNIPFPYSYKFGENKDGTFCMQKANSGFQLALIFYNPFRKLYLTGERKEYEFEEIEKIIKNTKKIVQDDEADNEKEEWQKWQNDEEKKIENMLFPYLIEQVFGINLCCEFTRYYETISKLDEFDEEVADILNHIFCSLCSMPNVFSRIQILREFMESVMLFEMDIKRQLAIINRVLKEMNQEYLENIESIINIFKEFEKNQKTQYFQALQSKNDSMRYIKNIFHSQSKESYIFAKKCSSVTKKDSIYPIFQEKYMKI